MAAEELDSLKRRRAAFKGVATRIANKVGRFISIDPLDLEQELLVQQAAALTKAEESYYETHQTIVSDFASSINEGDEQATLEKHELDVQATASRLRQLISLQKAYAEVKDLQQNLATLEDAMAKVPSQSYKRPIKDIDTQLQALATILKQGTVPRGDAVYDMKTDLQARYTTLLVADENSRSATGSTPSTGSAPTHKYRLPKFTIPEFHGDPMQWATFWQRFSSSVDSNDDLNENDKLTYLREAIKDKKAADLVMSTSSTPGQYAKLVALLKERYDQRRLIHQSHVMAIVNHPPVKAGGYEEICDFHDLLVKHLSGLHDTGQYDAGAILTSLAAPRLNARLHEQWLTYSRKHKAVPDIKVFIEFLKEKMATNTPTSTSASQAKPVRHEFKRAKASVCAANAADNCKLCGGERHPLYCCPTFKTLPHDKKMSTVTAHKACQNCLAPGHSSKVCRSSHRCKKCSKLHHTMLHIEGKPSSTNPHSNDGTSDTTASTSAEPQRATINVTSAPVQSTTSPHEDTKLPPTLQMTSQVYVESHDGRRLKARALLDSGASISLITQRLAQQLHLKKHHQPIAISGVQDTATGVSQYTTSFIVASVNTTQDNIQVSAAIVPKVSANLPLQFVSEAKSWAFLKDLTLADPNFAIPGRIDLILGSNALSRILASGIHRGTDEQPIAVNTIFGWTITGPYRPLRESAMDKALCHVTTGCDCDTLLKAFWEIEEVNTNSPYNNMTPEEVSVVDHFKNHHEYTPQGRYQVALPKQPTHSPLGESRSQAVYRFTTNEKNLHRKGTWQPFKDVVEEYLELGHAEPVPTSEANKPHNTTYYLPMHAVHKPSSTTTKLRVVFDASAKTRTGVSLNDILMVGPTTYPQLVDILLRFRRHSIAMTADISKMYREVELSPPDRDLHRFVWRSSPEQELKDYRMTRVTFGVSASPFAATQVLQQIATDFGADFPDAARAVRDSFYVDDCIAGADSIPEATSLQQQLQPLLEKGGFTLRKWRSNSPEVLKVIPTHLQEESTVQAMPSPVEFHKTLGIHWDSSEDNFYVATASLKPSGMLTKRSLVSDIARTFDVLGWFTPSTICMKILMQSLWETRTGWDEEVPESIQQTWSTWREQLPLLGSFPIKRFYFTQSATIDTIELHGFSDASEQAYAAAVYIKANYIDSQPSVTLVTAKSKVAPLKRESIPRLELCGALLMAKLLHTVQTALHLSLDHVYAWTDSTVVLNWLDGSPRRYKTYVGNRVAATLELLPASVWRHVPTGDNPADCASRGMLPQQLIQHNLWWEGPPWLRQDPSSWPPQPVLTPADAGPEIKATCNITTTANSWLIDKFSSFSRLKRVLAWTLRFLHHLKATKKHSELRLTATLQLQELQDAEQFLLKQSQARWFDTEFTQLCKKDTLNNNSVLLPLRPFLDGNYLLRVGGRLARSHLKYSKRHPIILHGKDKLAHLVANHRHRMSSHAGPTLLMSLLSRDFHVIGCKRLVRSICRKCIICRRLAAKPDAQLMGQLPPQRVTPGPVFRTVGIDFAGPLYTKYSHTRKPVIVKTYVCVFVSFTVRAVHLEPVSDLTTEAFVAALRRFISRRGKPTEIFSDNGSNFVGASKEITSLYQFLIKSTTQDQIMDFCATNGISWKFSPERAPHFGGLWESTVKSMKNHLRKVMGETRLTFEELTTLLCQVEACLNSRPLCTISKHDDDGIEILTPGHFLVGQPLEALPDRDTQGLKTSLLKRWNLCQALVQSFWTRWSHEYIGGLQRLTKWKHPTRNLRINDVVLVREDNLVTTRWPLARVVQVYPGNDGKVRVATVRTASGTYKRPVVKLALLLPEEDTR